MHTFDPGNICHVAEKFAYARHDGQLKEFVEVALPVYKLHVSALVLAQKPLPPIEEFILRSASLGFTQVESLSCFLGLEPKIIEGAIVNLQRDGDADFYEDNVWITAKGRQTAVEAERIKATEQSFEVYFDGLTRTLLDIRESDTLTAAQVRKMGLDEFPPNPVDLPRANEITTEALSSCIKTVYPNAYRQIANFIAVRRIISRRHEFLKAFAFFYKISRELFDVAIVYRGRFSEERTQRFRASRSRKRSFIMDSLARESSISDDSSISPLLKRADGLRANQEKLTQDLIDCRLALSAIQGDGSLHVLNELEGARHAVTRATRARWELSPASVVSSFEHLAFVETGLQEAKERVLISSPYVTSAALTPITEILARALARGVSITICSDFSRVQDKHAHSSLWNLAEKYEGLSLRRTPVMELCVLACDSLFVVYTDFEWLSYMGGRANIYRQLDGLMITVPQIVDQAFEHAETLPFWAP